MGAWQRGVEDANFCTSLRRRLAEELQAHARHIRYLAREHTAEHDNVPPGKFFCVRIKRVEGESAS